MTSNLSKLAAKALALLVAAAFLPASLTAQSGFVRKTLAVYPLRAASEPVAVPYSVLKLLSIPGVGSPARIRGRTHIRAFQGSKSDQTDLAKHWEREDCLLYDYKAFDVSLNGALLLNTTLSPDWLNSTRDERKYVEQHWTLVLTAGPPDPTNRKMWLQKDSVAPYFANGVEIVVQPTREVPEKPCYTCSGLARIFYSGGYSGGVPMPYAGAAPEPVPPSVQETCFNVSEAAKIGDAVGGYLIALGSSCPHPGYLRLH